MHQHQYFMLQQLGIYGPLRCREIYALDKLLREARTLEVISGLSKDKSGYISTAEEVMPLLKDKTVFSLDTLYREPKPLQRHGGEGLGEAELKFWEQSE